MSIVLPVYRNAETLLELYTRLITVLQSHQIDREIIFVDDASSDESLQILENLARKDATVGVLALTKNVGQHRAILLGLAHAHADIIVVMDADLQDPPEAIPLLLSKLSENFSAVFAGKRGHYESVSRLITSRIYKVIFHLLSGAPIDAGLYFAIDRRMCNRLLQMRVNRPSIIAMLASAGLPLVSIPVERSRRVHGTSAYTFFSRFKSGLVSFVSLLSLRVQLKLARPVKIFHETVEYKRIGNIFQQHPGELNEPFNGTR
ncbi:MAG: glycosyltransferase family 2 protein [Chloroflexi bacterium]|nr:glycosyltransferase family 2 protein [Chloroflexota bacterium]